MDVFNVLDVIVRGFFIPCIWIFFLSLVPETRDNMKEFFYIMTDGRKIKRKRKTVQVHTAPTVVYSNSFLKYLSYSNDFIVSHK